MKIRVETIDSTGSKFAQPLATSWLVETMGPNCIFTPIADGSLAVNLTRVEDVVQAQGEIKLSLRTDCSRCLERLVQDFKFPIALTFFPDGELPAGDEDGQLGADQMNCLTYVDSEIDLGEIVHDEVVLELPTKPLCRTSCAGLCPQCGVNLNLQPCDCPEPVDPRWAGLKGLKVN